MKWEYLQVYLDERMVWVAFDGNSNCHGDENLIRLLNKLGQDEWEYCQFYPVNYRIEYREILGYHLLKRSLP